MASPLLDKSKAFALLIESGYYNDTSVLTRCIEIKKMLISSINTAKKKQ